MPVSLSPPPLLSRKRRKSESTPPITNFFPILKRQRSNSESLNITQKLEDFQSLTSAPREDDDDDASSIPLDYSKEELYELLEITDIRCCSSEAHLESLSPGIYKILFTILDLKSLSSVAITSKTLANHVKKYTADHAFNRRFQLDTLDFHNCSFRLDEDEFHKHDPYFACGLLLKSITITLDTGKRASVFLNICRNLNSYLGGELSGFGRILDGMTKCWKFSERRIMVKAAILIDDNLHGNIVKVLTNPPGKYAGLEMKIRSRLRELFLNRNNQVDDMSPEETIEFGAWLSILLRNFTEKYRGIIYYLLFGPAILRTNGESISWSYFESFSDSDSVGHFHIMRIRLTALLNGIRALRIMSKSNEMDMWWTNKNIYRLFLRVVECSSGFSFGWTPSVVAMALAIDTTGLLSEYLLTCCDPNKENFDVLQDEAAEMICAVRSYLYSWTGSPSTYMFEPLQIAFVRLARIDGEIGGNYYRMFLNKIWEKQNDQIDRILDGPSENRTKLLKIELGGQMSVAHLLCCYEDMMLLQQENARYEENRVAMHHVLRDVLLEQEEQLED